MRPLRCIGFGTPPSCCPLLDARFNSSITTVVNDDDMIPRLTAHSARALLDSVLAYDWQTSLAIDIEAVVDEAMVRRRKCNLLRAIAHYMAKRHAETWAEAEAEGARETERWRGGRRGNQPVSSKQQRKELDLGCGKNWVVKQRTRILPFEGHTTTIPCFASC